jgi:hypothetical protein
MRFACLGIHRGTRKPTARPVHPHRTKSPRWQKNPREKLAGKNSLEGGPVWGIQICSHVRTGLKRENAATGHASRRGQTGTSPRVRQRGPYALTRTERIHKTDAEDSTPAANSSAATGRRTHHSSVDQPSSRVSPRHLALGRTVGQHDSGVRITPQKMIIRATPPSDPVPGLA